MAEIAFSASSGVLMVMKAAAGLVAAGPAFAHRRGGAGSVPMLLRFKPGTDDSTPGKGDWSDGCFCLGILGAGA